MTGNRLIDTPDWIIGAIETHQGTFPVVSTALRFPDRVGSWKVRWGINRMGFRVNPGLYAIGNPTASSLVFVTANYKMSFDRLRAGLEGIDSWILVLDTKGINVWCAAGKGTFGTDELVARLSAVRLGDIVSHRRLIIPQLGAVGVSAHEVKRRSGFRVVYGPIRADDVRKFMDDGMKATPEMRQVRFSFRDRIVLIPIEITGTVKYALPAALILLLIAGFGPGGYSAQRVMTAGMINAVVLLVAFLAGATLPPALLPWLPGRAFSVKGAWVGLGFGGILVALAIYTRTLFPNWLVIAGWLCLIPVIASFLAMNFTGSSTYTSLSGVKREMRVAVPLQLGFAVSGLGLWVAGIIVGKT